MYYVYVKSSRCSTYYASNSKRYDIRVTASKFRCLGKERVALREKLHSTYKEATEAYCKTRVLSRVNTTIGGTTT